MLAPSFLLLHPDNPVRSAACYEALLGTAPLETSPTFAMFGLPNGLRIGLWCHTAEPAPAGAPGARAVSAQLESLCDFKRMKLLAF